MTQNIPGASIPGTVPATSPGQALPGAAIPGAIPGAAIPGTTVQPGVTPATVVVPGSDFSGGGAAGVDILGALDDATPAEGGGGGLPDGDYAFAIQEIELLGPTAEKPEATPRISIEFVVVGAEDAKLNGRKHTNSFFLSTKAAPYTRSAMINLGFGSGSGADVRAALAAGTHRGHGAICTLKTKAGKKYPDTYVNKPIGRYPTDANGAVVLGSQPVAFPTAQAQG